MSQEKDFRGLCGMDKHVGARCCVVTKIEACCFKDGRKYTLSVSGYFVLGCSLLSRGTALNVE